MASSLLKTSSRPPVAPTGDGAPEVLRDLVRLLAVSAAQDWDAGDDNFPSEPEHHHVEDDPS